MCHLPRHVRSAGAGLLASLLFSSIAAAAQNPPLAEVARQEAERRKANTAATKVLTNQDLRKVPARVAAPPADAAATPPAGEKADVAAPNTPADAVEKNEIWWRVRIAEPRDMLRRDQVLFDALQARVNGLTSELIAREPFQRARLDDERQKAILEMDRVRAEIEGARKSIDDIEEEARRAGVPPGWLR